MSGVAAYGRRPRKATRIRSSRRIAPDSRVVYVDNYPLVLAHARALLTSAPEGRTAYIPADLRDPASILANPATQDVLDPTQPVALMLVAVLHFINDDDNPADIVRTLLDALPSGSYLVASHLTGEHDQAAQTSTERAYRGASKGRDLRHVCPMATGCVHTGIIRHFDHKIG